MIVNQRTVKSIRDPRTGKYYSPAELDGWATRLTNIKTNKGSSKDRRYGRSKGRYLKGKL